MARRVPFRAETCQTVPVATPTRAERLRFLAGTRGFEPLTGRLACTCSIQLSYNPAYRMAMAGVSPPWPPINKCSFPNPVTRGFSGQTGWTEGKTH